MLHTFGQNTKYLCIILLPQQEGYLTQTRGIHATLQSKKYYKITKCPLPHIKTVSTLLWRLGVTGTQGLSVGLSVSRWGGQSVGGIGIGLLG